MVFFLVAGQLLRPLVSPPAVSFRPRGETPDTKRRGARHSTVHTGSDTNTTRPPCARRGGMASTAAPSPLPMASLSAPRAVAAAAPHVLGFPRRLKPSTGVAPRCSLRVVASSSKVDPVEERAPVAPLAGFPVPAGASPPGPSLQPQPQVSTG